MTKWPPNQPNHNEEVLKAKEDEIPAEKASVMTFFDCPKWCFSDGEFLQNFAEMVAMHLTALMQSREK